MSNRILNILTGAGAGFVVGFLTHSAVEEIGILPTTTGWGTLVLAAIGAVCGGVLGEFSTRPSQAGGSIARWSIGMAALIGGLAFLAGFAGPIILSPGNPQGPLLGIFFTGPLGVVAGAILGAVIGALMQLANR